MSLASRQGAQALRFLTRKVFDMAAMTDNLHYESNNSLRGGVLFCYMFIYHNSFQAEQAEISFESRI